MLTDGGGRAGSGSQPAQPARTHWEPSAAAGRRDGRVAPRPWGDTPHGARGPHRVRYPHLRSPWARPLPQRPALRGAPGPLGGRSSAKRSTRARCRSAPLRAGPGGGGGGRGPARPLPPVGEGPPRAQRAAHVTCRSTATRAAASLALSLSVPPVSLRPPPPSSPPRDGGWVRRGEGRAGRRVGAREAAGRGGEVARGGGSPVRGGLLCLCGGGGGGGGAELRPLSEAAAMMGV